MRLLFVCLGNICRSPMAEAVFRGMAEDAEVAGRFAVDSAGTGSWHVGKEPHAGTRKVLRSRGIACSHRARCVAPADLEARVLLVAMDAANRADLLRLGAAPDRVVLLLDYAPGMEGADVPDPYYTGDFEETYRLVEAGCRGLLQSLRRAQGW